MMIKRGESAMKQIVVVVILTVVLLLVSTRVTPYQRQTCTLFSKTLKDDRTLKLEKSSAQGCFYLLLSSKSHIVFSNSSIRSTVIRSKGVRSNGVVVAIQ